MGGTYLLAWIKNFSRVCVGRNLLDSEQRSDILVVPRLSNASKEKSCSENMASADIMASATEISQRRLR